MSDYQTTEAIKANTRATYALVEQQRIANLIALEKVWKSTAVEAVPGEDGLDFRLVRYDLLEDIADSLKLPPLRSTSV